MDLKQFTDIDLNLEILAEEAAEVIQVKSKIKRFGLHDTRNKMHNTDKREWLEQECGHVLAMIEILIFNGVLTEKGLMKGKYHKIKKLSKWYKKMKKIGV